VVAHFQILRVCEATVKEKNDVKYLLVRLNDVDEITKRGKCRNLVKCGKHAKTAESGVRAEVRGGYLNVKTI
jgi:hypothetical protein